MIDCIWRLKQEYLFVIYIKQSHTLCADTIPFKQFRRESHLHTDFRAIVNLCKYDSRYITYYFISSVYPLGLLLLW